MIQHIMAEREMKMELTEKEIEELHELQEYFEEQAAEDDIGIEYVRREEPEREFLIQAKGDDYSYNKLVSEAELVHYIDMQDYCTEQHRIFEVTNMGQIKEIWYAGWKPGCIIDFIDESGKIVAGGIGTDH